MDFVKLKYVLEKLSSLLAILFCVRVLESVALSVDEYKCTFSSDKIELVEHLHGLDLGTCNHFKVRVFTFQLYEDLWKLDRESFGI